MTDNDNNKLDILEWYIFLIFLSFFIISYDIKFIINYICRFILLFLLFFLIIIYSFNYLRRMDALIKLINKLKICRKINSRLIKFFIILMIK